MIVLTALKIAMALLAWVMAVIIITRCINVLRGMHLRRGSALYWKTLGFGLCYVALAGSSIGAALVITHGDFTLSHVGFLVSSSGLILCDRRRRQPKAEVPA